MTISKMWQCIAITFALQLLVVGYLAYERPSVSARASVERPTSDAVLFFWYGCGHCREVERIFRAESAEQKITALLKDGEHFLKIPAPLNPTWEMHARLYYALDHLKVSSDTHWYVMNLIQDKRLHNTSRLSGSLGEIAGYVNAHNPGVMTTGDKLAADMHNPKTDAEIRAAKQLVQAVGLRGVPAMLVNKQSLIELGNGVGYHEMLPAVLKLLSGSKEAPTSHSLTAATRP